MDETVAVQEICILHRGVADALGGLADHCGFFAHVSLGVLEGGVCSIRGMETDWRWEMGGGGRGGWAEAATYGYTVDRSPGGRTSTASSRTGWPATRRPAARRPWGESAVALPSPPVIAVVVVVVVVVAAAAAAADDGIGSPALVIRVPSSIDKGRCYSP